MGIRKANRKKIPTTTVADLGVSAAPTVTWSNVRKPEVRKTEVVMIEGESVQEKAAGLADALMAEKVI